MNIIQKQALRLVNERWFDVPTAVSMAIESQIQKWFANKDWKLNYRWEQYWKLTSEQRAEVRKEIDAWASRNDFNFYNGKIIRTNVW